MKKEDCIYLQGCEHNCMLCDCYKAKTNGIRESLIMSFALQYMNKEADKESIKSLALKELSKREYQIFTFEINAGGV